MLALLRGVRRDVTRRALRVTYLIERRPSAMLLLRRAVREAVKVTVLFEKSWP